MHIPQARDGIHRPLSDELHEGQLVMSWLVHVVDESAGWTVDTAMRLMTKPLREIVRLRGQSAKGLDGHAQ